MDVAGVLPAGGTMADLWMILIVLVFFALSFGFVSLCDRLR